MTYYPLTPEELIEKNLQKHYTKSITRYKKYRFSNHNDLIEKVIFNNPATIIIWNDGSKTVVKCGEYDLYDPEKGMAMAISKKFFGNEGYYYEAFKKWIPIRNMTESIIDK